MMPGGRSSIRGNVSGGGGKPARASRSAKTRRSAIPPKTTRIRKGSRKDTERAASSRGVRSRSGLLPDVYLRPPQRSDRAEFLALNRASRRFHRGWVAPPCTDAAFRAFLQRSRRPQVETRLICRREDDVIVGALSLSEIVRGGFQSAYLGYYLGADFAGRGYMSAALRRALALAFGPLRLHRVEANIQPRNAASIALVRGAGFRLEGFSPRYLKIAGRWRDHERWAIRAEDWKRRGPSVPARPSRDSRAANRRPGPPRRRRA